MNREDIIRMAREAGIEDWWDSGNEHREVLQEHLERFAALVASAEREWVIDLLNTKYSFTPPQIVEDIRARGPKPPESV